MRHITERLSTCGVCGKQFNLTQTIDGKTIFLVQGRLCLECSPYRAGNSRTAYKIKLLAAGLSKCSACKLEKPLSEFNNQNKDCKDRLNTRCKECEKLRATKARKAHKNQAVEYKGGCCQVCGYDKYEGALEFHHINPEEKDFSIASIALIAFDKVKPELDKCILLCANCHREVHAGITSVPSTYESSTLDRSHG